jgi:hypothetical protein
MWEKMVQQLASVDGGREGWRTGCGREVEGKDGEGREERRVERFVSSLTFRVTKEFTLTSIKGYLIGT